MIKNLKILFVDDDAITRMVLSSQLSSRYSEVLSAADGKEGLQLCLKEKPDVLVTDQSMPVMTGTEMIAEIRREIPAQKVILVSGFAESVEENDDLPILMKPLTVEVLCREINRISGV